MGSKVKRYLANIKESTKDHIIMLLLEENIVKRDTNMVYVRKHVNNFNELYPEAKDEPFI